MVGDVVNNYSDHENVQNKWLTLEMIIKQVAREVLIKQSKHTKKDWYDSECKETVKCRNKVRLEMQLCNSGRKKRDTERHEGR